MNLHYYGHHEDERKLLRGFAMILVRPEVLLSEVLQGRWEEEKR
jgi:hypothetical protein